MPLLRPTGSPPALNVGDNVMIRALGLAALISLSYLPASAGELFAGAYQHDANVGIAICCFEKGADIEIGGATSPLESLSRWGEFKLYGLLSANTSGGVSFAAGGLAWRIGLGPRFYFEPGIGGAVQNGSALPYQATRDKLYLGSRFLFEPQVALGYRISPKWSVEASYVHLSHARLASLQNPGLDDLGVRAIYHFGP